MSIHFVKKRFTREDFHLVNEIKQIPMSILKENISLIEYSADNFQSISYMTRIEDKQITNQYFIGKVQKLEIGLASFDGLKYLMQSEFQELNSDIIESKKDDEFDGMVVFTGIPPKEKRIHKSEGVTNFEPKRAFDHSIDVCQNALPKNYQAFIFSTIKKKKTLIGSQFGNNFNYKFFLKLLVILSWVLLSIELPLQLYWKIYNIELDSNEIPTMLDNSFLIFGQKCLIFFEDIDNIIALMIWLSILIGGILIWGYLRKRKNIPEVSKQHSEEQEGGEIAKAKSRQAKISHIEEMRQWGAVKQSFVILVRGKNPEIIKHTLESLKRSITGIYKGCIFQINGTIVMDYDHGTFSNIKRVFGWSIQSFWDSFRKVRPYKPTVISIPRAGKNFFRLPNTKFIPGTNIIDGNSYIVPTDRTKQGLYLGEIYRKIGGERYPYYIKLQDLLRQGLIVGQTGRGKTFFTYLLLKKISKSSSDTHFCIFDLKGGEYARLFAKQALVYSPGSDVSPLGINIFRVSEENIESNKRLVQLLLNEFMLYQIGPNIELSAFMKDIVNQAIDRVFLESYKNRTMKTFIVKISEILDELEEDGLGWTEKTRTALKARFRELFTGWFQKIFCAEQSNFNVEMLRENNIIFKLNHLVSDNDLMTVKFLVNTIMSLISSYSKELRDLDSDYPWLVCIFEEAQKIIPLVHKKDSSEASTAENFVEIARAHRVSSIAIGQNPSKISERFHQAGFIIDFGTESDVLDKVIFGKDHLHAAEEKEQLAKSQMCFVKLTGERRVLLQVADFDHSDALNEEQLNSFMQNDEQYANLRANYQIQKILPQDMEGKKGKRRIQKQGLLHQCQVNCELDNCLGLKFTKHKLPRKTRKQLAGMMKKEEGDSFIRFCHHIAQEKEDAPCILLHYLNQMLDENIIGFSEANELLEKGRVFYLLEEKEQGKEEQIKQDEEILEIHSPIDPSDNEDEISIYSFDFNGLILEEGNSK